jgi:dienelactone hydrolase
MKIFIFPLLFIFPILAGELHPYKVEGKPYEGYYQKATSNKSIAVLVAHAWKGIGEHERTVVDQLASLGYSTLAADVYGKGVRPADQNEASAESKKHYGNRKELRSRIEASRKELSRLTGLPESQIVAIGYCFGGTTVLELARSGAKVAGVVSFHGGIKPDLAQVPSKISTSVTALHGADDPYVPAEDVQSFVEEMKDQKADWQLVHYGNSVHSFTFESAGVDNSKGAAFNQLANSRSWALLLNFLDEKSQ